jgi:hypothetical protein
LAEYLHEQGCDNGQLLQVVQDKLRRNTVAAGKSLLKSTGKSRTMLQRSYRRGIRLARTLSDKLLSQTARRGAGLRVFDEAHHLPIGWIHFGNLRRVTPISRVFGLDRGTPIDRYYIEKFLHRHESDICGYVMEVGDPNYTRKFGGDRVTKSAVFSAPSDTSRATLVGDLCTGEDVPQDAFDCMILTQVFHVLYDIKTAVGNAVRALKPGGVMLVTLPGISQISRYDADRWGDFWRFTSQSARRLFEDHFAPENLEINLYGNVLTAVAFLYGLAAQELQTAEMDHQDPDYEMIIAVRAVKPGCEEESDF